LTKYPTSPEFGKTDLFAVCGFAVIIIFIIIILLLGHAVE
jgi:hypothetical protein